jgi:hypothetical protein
MRLARSITLRSAAVAALGTFVLAGTAPTAGATTLKVKGGTTTLTFGRPAIQALSTMGISFAPVAPASAAGEVLSFPIRSGTLKVTGGARKKVAGTITHRGGMTLSNSVLAVGLSKPMVRLAGRRSELDTTSVIGTAPPLTIDMATLDLSRAKMSVTRKRVRIGRVHVKLTSLAASAMNAGFGVTGFTPGFEIGTATVKAAVKR